MSNYTKTTDFEAKDSLPTGDSGKIIRGAEFETEFDAISTAIATKADTAGPTFTGTLTFETISDGTIGVTAFVDEDDMSSDSATLVPTQQSVKAYVDSQVTAQDLDFQADSGGALSIDLDSETMTFTGGTGIDTSGSGNAVTFAIDSTVATLTGSQTLTNKTLTSPDVNTPDIDGGTIDGTVIGGTTPAAVSATTVSATGNITVGGTVDGRDVATDGTKLDGIESGATADQTAAEIRTLVESATDSNVFTDADHSKLDGIEAGATGDQTNAEIRAAVEAATDSNVFTDADHSKLDGIEAGADVTDTTNVTAAGAVMDSELTSEASVKALNQGVATTDSPTFDGLTIDSSDVTLATIQRDGGGSPSSFGGYNIKFNAANSSLGDNYFLGVNVGGGFNLSRDSSNLQPIFTATSTGIDVNGTVEFDGLSGTGAVSVTDILDQDDMSSNSATALATQQSIKAYVDSQVATVDTLAEVLGNGNTTGGTDIAVGTGDDITFADNSKAIFGAGSDLQIYHSGSQSFVQENGTGQLVLDTQNGARVKLTSNNGTENMVVANKDGDVELYYDNAQKLATTSTGIDVTGTAVTDGLTVDGNTTNLNYGKTFFTNGIGTNKWQIWNDNGGSDKFQLVDGDGHLVLQAEQSGDISFYEDTGTTAKLFWDASAESLGIGTTSPSASLELNVPTGDGLLINSADIGTIKMTLASGSQKNWGFATTNLAAGDFGLYQSNSNGGDPITAGTAKLYINSSGNVGIGNDAPTTLLHVGDGSSGAENIARIEGRTTVGGQEVGSLQFYQVTNAPDEFIGAEVQLQSGSGRSNSALVFNVSQASNTDASEAMRIDSSGRVGIGTSSPSSNLHVKNTASNAELKVETAGGLDARLILDAPSASGAQSQIFFDASGTTAGSIQYTHNSGGTNFMTFHTGGSNAERMRIDSSGNVGIGASPVAGLHIQTATRSLSLAPSATGGGGASHILMGNSDSGGTAGPNVIVSGNRNLQFGVGDDFSSATGGTFSEYMRIDSSGNLLVGTTNNNVTSTSGNNPGINIGVAGIKGFMAAARYQGPPLSINRLGNDGDIQLFSKDGTTVGSIGNNTDFYIASQDGVGLRFTNNQVLPCSESGAIQNGSRDLGSSSGRFKDLYLSGKAIVGAGSSSAPSITASNDTDAGLFWGGGFLGFTGGSSHQMRLDSSGNLLLNDTTAAAKLWVNRSDAGNTFGARATSSAYTSTVGFFGADRNTTNGTFHYIDCYNYGSSTYRFRVADSGNVTNTNNSYGAISDVRLKENIVDATPKLDKLNEVRIVNYNFIGSDEKQLGVIAQELEQIMPNMVDENVDKDEDGNELGTTTKTVKYSVFVPMLIKAMQEQTEIINDLRARVAQLEGEN